MADNLTTPIAEDTVLATRELGGAHYNAVVIATESGADVSEENPLPVDIGSGPFSVTGGLTDTQLRATAVPVSLASSVAVTGPLTDTQLRATAVPVSGTVGVSGTVPVSGPLTDTQLRATALPVSGAVGISGSVAVTGTFFQATQPISAASLPLPSGAATSAKQDAAADLLEAGLANPHFPALRSDPMAPSGASRRKQPPSSTGGYIWKKDKIDPDDQTFTAAGKLLTGVQPKNMPTAQLDWLTHHLDTIDAAIPGGDYQSLIDVKSFADHHILNVFANNADGLQFSTFYHQPPFPRPPVRSTPISPPSGPIQWLLQGPPAESNLLAAQPPFPRPPVLT
jgi:hypothetical protein